MKFKILIIVCLFSLFSCFGPKSYRCNFLPETDPPDWVVSGNTEISGFYVGTGESGKSEHGPTGQLAEAKKRAIDDLAASIQVFVRNEVSVLKSSDQNSNLTKMMSHHIVNMSLGNLQQEGRWLNRDACVLYVRVKLNKTIADQMLKVQMENIEKFNRSQSLFILAKNDHLKTEERVLHLEEANNILKEIDFNALNTSMVTSKKYTFYYNRNSRLLEEVQSDAKGYLEYIKLKQTLGVYYLAHSKKKRRTSRIRYINKAILKLNTVDFDILNNSKYMENDKKYYVNKFYNTRSFLKDKIRFYINTGMNEKMVIKILGKPIEKTKTYYLPLFERGYRYNKYWIIFKNGLVNCIVNVKGFRLNPGGLCRSCKWHKRYHPRSVIK